MLNERDVATERRPYVLVTGAGGFVGRAVAERLRDQGHHVRRSVRRAPGCDSLDTVQVEIGPDTDWTTALDGVDTVVHVAACVHRRNTCDAAVQREMNRVNVEGTRRLTAAARACGVKTLVFISSIGAAVDRSVADVDEDAFCQPETVYGRSKLAAEQAIAEERGSMRAAILRPPLVYGKDAPGNFGRLVEAVRRGWPLPFGRVSNRRSFIYVGNLADAIVRAVECRADGVFHVADAQPVSTPDLIRAVAAASGVPVRLLNVPPAWLVPAARIIGLASAVRKLTESLPVDGKRFCTAMSWTPPWDMERALEESLGPGVCSVGATQ